MFLIGVLIGCRYLYFLAHDPNTGHIQSLILAAILMIMGFQTVITGLLSDIIAANRKLLEDTQYRVRILECMQNKRTLNMISGADDVR